MKTFSIFVLVLVMCLPAMGNIAHNQWECFLAGQCCSNCRSSQDIKQSIVDSGALLIMANANYQLFLNKVELSDYYGLDISVLDEYISMTIDNMEKAERSYYQLIVDTQGMEYQDSKISKLKEFDYSRGDAIKEVWKRVEFFLSSGNIKGAINETYYDCVSILDSLYAIRSQIKSGDLPLENIQRLYQKFCETQLFCQYCAEVYQKVKNE